MNDQNNQECLNRYEERQAQRKERYEELAQKASGKSANLATRSTDMAKLIPFGQPIMIGHHSEKQDRKFREKIFTVMGQSVQEQNKAEHYARKAESVGKGGISSDDPDAIGKLESKLQAMQDTQKKMKLANKLIKKVQDSQDRINGLLDLGYDQKTVLEILDNRYGYIGFPSFTLTNRNAEINRLKKRIEQLKALENRTEQTIENELYEYKECKIENRCMFIFEGKPIDEIRQILKSNGFKWSPSRGAWVRQLTANGIYASKKVMQSLNSI